MSNDDTVEVVNEADAELRRIPLQSLPLPEGDGMNLVRAFVTQFLPVPPDHEPTAMEICQYISQVRDQMVMTRVHANRQLAAQQHVLRLLRDQVMSLQQIVDALRGIDPQG